MRVPPIASPRGPFCYEGCGGFCFLLSGLPEDYATVLAGLKQRVREARFRAQRQVNTELIRLNWQIGQVLAERTDRAQWGDKSIQRLSVDLLSEFPGSRGFSPRNLLYMRAFARAWPGLNALACWCR